MSVPLPPTSQPRLRRMIQRPWTARARRSPAVRRWLDRHGYITPHFTWASYACTDGTPVPARLRKNAIRFHWRLEIFRHRLGDVGFALDGPFRTASKNRAVGGAELSRHLFADGGDIFAGTVDSIVRRSHKVSTRMGVVKIAERTFTGVGNEGSGTLHVDQRPGRAVRFVSWVAGR